MTDRLSRKEQISALFLLVLHCFVLPLIVGQAELNHPGALSAAQYNLIYYCISAVLCFVLLWNYLKDSFYALCSRPGRFITAMIVGWALYLALNLAVNPFMSLLGVSETDPNTQSMVTMLKENRRVIVTVTLILAPIVEESIFRGGIFCGLYHKNRAAAYMVTILLFAFYHVWQFLYVTGDVSYLLYMIAYIPAALALCVVYEISGSVWVSMVFHASFNAVSLSAMGLL